MNSSTEGRNQGRRFPGIESAVASACSAGARVGRRTTIGSDQSDGGRGPRVTIVIPVFNQAEMTEKCLFAIAENTGEDPDYGVVVVDNGSTDWTMYLLHAMEGDVQVLNNDQNEGFASACNKGGAAGVTGEYLLFLNNDTVPRPGWLRALVDVADSSPEIGVVGAKLVYPDSGKIQHAGIAMVEGVPDHVNRGVDEGDPQVNEVRDLDMVTGACLLIRKALFEQLGGFDANFINGAEDVDLCLRVRDLGFRVVYCPDSVVEHHEGASEGRFDNVAANLGLFRERWGHRFDAQGHFVAERVEGSAPEAGGVLSIAEQSEATQQPFTVNWEGSFMLHSSLAYVNREMALALLASERCDLGLQSFEPDEFGVEEDARFWPLAQRMDRPYPQADFHVKHRWPPDFSRPHDDARFILMQPWEFGRLP
ncbi:MAG: glycosyltransferase family 2 protein, partial [Pirellulaceae bacterium]|nr:glycosyltransferase family 2 protein [Pirellulaceae bacterium]